MVISKPAWTGVSDTSSSWRATSKECAILRAALAMSTVYSLGSEQSFAVYSPLLLQKVRRNFPTALSHHSFTASPDGMGSAGENGTIWLTALVFNESTTA